MAYGLTGVLLVAFAGAAGCSEGPSQPLRHDLDPVEDQLVVLSETMAPGDEVLLSDLVDIDWDRVGIFPVGTSADDIDERLAAEGSGKRISDLASLGHGYWVVFVDDGCVVGVFNDARELLAGGSIHDRDVLLTKSEFYGFEVSASDTGES
jgi:hypothetical protein